MRPNDVYFAAKEANEAAAVLMDRSNDWFQTIYSNGYLNKLRTMWQSYHGAYYTDGGIGNDSHSITFGGEQGELVQLPINHIRNLAQHMLNIITSTRPAMQARATNTDYKSLVQTRLANGLLDFYMRDHRLEEFLKTAVEYAIVFGSGYVKLEWNATRGEVYDTDPGSGDEIREGDIEFSNLSPFDVVFDTSAESKRCDWVITRSMKNKYDLMAKFPELADKIRNIPTIDDSLNSFMLLFNYGKTDMIPVYEFYHNRTEALPDGRYMLYLDSEVILLDSPMPYRNLPVYRIAPAYYLGTNYGYTPMFDLLPTQDAVNSLYSTILTNQTAFGVQSVVVGKNSDLDITKFEGGMQVLEVNNPNEIQPLNLTNTPKEIFEFLGMLEKVMETLSGVNSVARGNPDPNLRSGNALALVQSMTLQFMSGLQQSYVALIEDMGTGIIDVLKDHATVPRIAAITGKNNRSYIKEFKGSDLENVSRVIVDIGNPLAKTVAGRVEMAEQMLQMGVLKTPEQYFMVIDTGQLDVMTEDTQSQLYLIKDENERLISKKQVRALLTDEHQIHIKEHAAILADSDLRFDEELVNATLQHIQEHIDILSNPAIAQVLMSLGQQPIQPPMPPPPPPDQNVPDASLQGQVPETLGGGPVNTALVQQGALPESLPGLPQVPADVLPNPAMQEMAMGNVKQ